ncbi:MAG: outer membrane protein YfgL, lipoprotein component of the protein assembly complex [Acidimicrobiales bacterium]|nr:outer membrane protein YfgL, lipoprotein component of the protein assembly complex [Acidimicrobiales bacterium]
MADADLPGTCPACGRSLPPAGAGGEMRCDGCGLLVREGDRSASSGPGAAGTAGAPGAVAAVGVPVAARASGSSGRRRASGRVWVGIVVVAVAAATVIATAVASGGHRAATSGGAGGAPVAALPADHLSLSSGDHVMLPGEPRQPLGFVGVFYDSSNDQRIVGRTRVGARGLDWKSAPLPKNVSSAVFALDAGRVFVGAKDQLLAFDLTRGTLAWKAQLSDEVETSCPTCFLSIGGRLIVRTRDAIVRALDPGTGRLLWQRRLEATNGKLLVAGGHLVVTDRRPKPAFNGFVGVVDLATGADVRRIQPTCPAAYDGGYIATFQPFDLIRAIPGTENVVVAVSSGSSCLQRWDLATGRQLWNVPIASASSLDDGHVLVGRTDMAIADSRRLDLFDLATGRARAMSVGQDESVKPQGLLAGLVVGVVSQTRGSDRPALAAWSRASGQRLWTRSLQGLAAFSPVDSRSTDALFSSEPGRFLVSMGGSDLRLVTLARQDTALNVETIDPSTGGTVRAVHGHYRPRYESGSYSVGLERVQGDQLVITVDSLLQTIDLGSGAVSATWPPS